MAGRRTSRDDSGPFPTFDVYDEEEPWRKRIAKDEIARLVLLGSVTALIERIEKTSVASSNVSPCFSRLLCALSASHSNATPCNWYIISMPRMCPFHRLTLLGCASFENYVCYDWW
jgi:hypothetical protein